MYSESKKRAFVAANMVLSERESEAFWPVYDRYQKELKELDERMIRMLNDYASEGFELSDEKAGELLNEYLAIEEGMFRLRETYLGAFKAVLPMRKVVRYYQLENKLQAGIRYEAIDGVPLVE